MGDNPGNSFEPPSQAPTFYGSAYSGMPPVQFPDFSVPPPPIGLPYDQFQYCAAPAQPVSRYPRATRTEYAPKPYERSASKESSTDSRSRSERSRTSEKSSRFSRYSDRDQSRRYSSQDSHRRDSDRDRKSVRERDQKYSSDRREQSSDSSRYRSRNQRRSRSPSARSSDRPSTSRNPSESRCPERAANTERDILLKKWRSNYCETSEDIAKRLVQLANAEEKDCWVRSSPADLYYKRDTATNQMVSTPRLDSLCECFESLVKRGEHARASQPCLEKPQPKRRHRVCMHKCKKDHFHLTA